MADPRADALMRALGSQGGPAPDEEMGESDQMSPEDAASQALSILEPFVDEPRIAKAMQLLQDVAGGPSEPSEDSMPAAPSTSEPPGPQMAGY